MQATFYVNDGYKNRARDSKAPPTPPERPTNKPVYFGNINDELIIRQTNYKLSVKLEKLLLNSKKTRRPRKNRRCPPRPQNPFILYRRDIVEKHKSKFAGLKSSVISKIVGKMWKDEKPETIEYFRALARLSEELHSQQHENYRYQPEFRKVRTSSKNKQRCSPSPDSPASNSTLGSPLVEYDGPSSDSSLSSSSSECDSPSSDSSLDFLFNESDSSNSDTFDNNNLDFTLDSIILNSSAESDNTVSNFCNLDNIELNPLEGSDINGLNASNTLLNFGTLDDPGLTEPNNTGLNFETLNGIIGSAPEPPVQNDDFNDFNRFVANYFFPLYNLWRTNPNQFMQPNYSINTLFLGQPFDEPDHNGFINPENI